MYRNGANLNLKHKKKNNNKIEKNAFNTGMDGAVAAKKKIRSIDR